MTSPGDASIPVFVALDAGSGSGRCVVFDAEGRLVAKTSREWQPFPETDVGPFCYRYDPIEIWSTLAALTREALSGVDPARVRGVSATAQRIGCAFLDADLNTLYLGPNRDVRALHSDLAIEAVVDEAEFYRVTRHWPPWMSAPARLLWFKAHDTGLYDRVRWVVSFSDWIIAGLCGEVVCEPTSAADLMLLDVAKRDWSAALTAAIGLDPVQLPAIRNPGEIAGKVTAAAATETRLPEGVPVAVGAGDTHTALLGAGVTRPGETCLVAGSSAPIMRVTTAIVEDPAGRLWNGCAASPDRWLLEANAGEAGAMQKWMLRMFGQDLIDRAAEDGTSPYPLFDELAKSAGLACAGATCHIGPRVFNLRSLNTARPAAMLMPFAGTGQDLPARSDFFRAFLENCAFAVRANMERIETIAGDRATRFVVGGGMSRSSLFGSILASVLNRETVLAAQAETSGLGAALCAAVGAGYFDSLGDAVDRVIREGTAFSPDEDEVDEYDDCYDNWLEREQQLEEF